jgi:hypothetical protein
MSGEEITTEEIATVSEFEKLDPRVILNEENVMILKSYALHSKTPPAVLLALAGHDNWEICRAVAQNTSAPPNVLLILSNHEKVQVRWTVASNVSTPQDVLDRLAADEYCAENVAANTSASPETLSKIISEAESQAILVKALSNPNTTLETIVRFLLSSVKKDYSDAIVSNPRFCDYLKIVSTKSVNSVSSGQVSSSEEHSKSQERWD